MEELRKAVDAATVFCAKRQVILPAIEQLAAGSMERLQRMVDAVNALISPDPLRREFFGHERLVATLEKLIRLNKTRADFQEKFEALIESYNAGSRNIEELFEELLTLSRNLSEEQQRHVRESSLGRDLSSLNVRRWQINGPVNPKTAVGLTQRPSAEEPQSKFPKGRSGLGLAQRRREGIEKLPLPLRPPRLCASILRGGSIPPP